MTRIEESGISPQSPGWASLTARSCLGAICGLLAYVLTSFLGGMAVFVALPREPIGPAGMIVALLMMNPLAWLAVVISAVLAVVWKKPFVWTAGSGVLVALLALLYASLLLRG